MAYSYVQQGSASGGSGVNSLLTSSITTTAGNILILAWVIGNSTSENPTTVSDATNGNYTSVGGSFNHNNSLFGGTTTGFYFFPNIAGGSVQATVKWTTGGGYSYAYLLEYSGIKTTSPADGFNAVSTQTSTNPSLSITATTGDLCMFMFADDSLMSAGNITNRVNIGSGEIIIGDAAAVGGSFTSSFTAASGHWCAGTAGFLLAPVVGGKGCSFFLE